MLSYKVKAQSSKGGNAQAEINNGVVKFDASDGRKEGLSNPAELLLASFAACMLKNVERFSKILKYDYTSAEIEVNGIRNDSPPYMSEITYILKVETTMEEKKLHLLHKNILKFGTITNTIAKAAILNGTIEFLNK
jgi:uncharacterized OsmC-like protein